MKDFGMEFERSPERPLVLVVDSEIDVLQQMSEALAESEFGCCCCASAAEAIAAAQATPPDLIVCDLNLRGESGSETCRQIKLYPGMENVPVMFLSGAQRPDIIRRSHVAADGVYCLRKPFAPNVLVKLIDQAIGVTPSASKG
jgi:two-component system, sensor histidine kinase and response regulator